MPASRLTMLGNRLRELRLGTFASGSEMARHLGWQQSRVSKLEIGVQMPKVEDVEAWATAVGADEDVRAELADMLTRARVEHTMWPDQYRKPGAAAARQAQIGANEREATTLREYQPAMVPGIVQTAAYARELLSAPGSAVLVGATSEEIEQLVGERVRRQEFLYQPGKHVHLVLGEAALHTRFATVQTLRGQLDRLVSFAELPSVDLRVLPFDAPSPIMPLAGISIEDEHALLVETLTDDQRVTDPEAVTAQVKAFELVRDAAVSGADAVALVQHVAERLRND